MTEASGRAAHAVVWLGLGSNVGDRAANLRGAILQLERVIALDALSPVYETEPVGWLDQPRFWNLVVRGRTTLAPRALLDAVKQIERQVGRVETFRMGPRVVDIDVLLHGNASVEDGVLTVPHPGLLERPFVLVPLLDIDAAATDPRTGTPLAAEPAAAQKQGMVKLGEAHAVLRLDEGRNA